MSVLARATGFPLLLALLLLILARGAVDARPELIDRIVAVVDREAILWSELNFRLDLYLRSSGYNFVPPEEELDRLRNILLDEMIDEQVLILKAKQDSIEIDNGEVEEILGEQYGDVRKEMTEEEFHEMLVKSGLTERQLRSRYRENIRNSLLMDQMRQLLAFRQTVTHRDVELYREAHADTLPTTIHVSQIKMRVEPDSSAVAGVHEKIGAVEQKLASGEDFAALARVYSEDPGTSADGGSLGCFSAGMFVTEFESAAYDLKPGQVSDPVLTRLGYHLILLHEKREDELCASHILIRASTTQEDMANVRKSLEELRQRALNGEGFSELVRAHSQDQGRSVLARDQIPRWLQPHIAQLKLGGISEPFFLDGNGHIVKINDDHATLERLLRESRMNVSMRQLIDEFKVELHVEKRAEYVGTQ